MRTAKTRNRSITDSKRIILVTGDKGGVGKSSFARGLLDVYQHLGIDCRAYDSDRRNAQLIRHYQRTKGGVAEIDISHKGEADALLNDLETASANVVLVDMPAGAGEWFETLEADLNLIETVAEMGYRLTLVSVVSRVKDSINALRLLMEYCDRRVDYVVAKNLYFGEAHQFARFDASKTRGQFLEFGGVEIVMPALFDASFDAVDQYDLTFRAAIAEGSPLSRANRSRVNQWLKLMETEIRKADKYLGIAP